MRETKQTLRANLEESEIRLALAAESAGAGIWSMEVGSGQFWATKKTREMFGVVENGAMSLDRLLGAIHSEDQKRTRQIVRAAIDRGTEFEFECRVLLDGGAVRWITSRGRPHFTANGELDRLTGVSFDITERKAAEEALRASLKE